jgi:hypothetical protein
MPELPPEVHDPDAPPGTPLTQQGKDKLAPVWCRHGIRWTYTEQGWRADDGADLDAPAGHDRPAQMVGAICGGDAVPYDPAEHPGFGPEVVEQAYAEAEAKVRRDTGRWDL